MWPFRRKHPASTVVTYMVTVDPASAWDGALNRYTRIRETWGIHLNAVCASEGAFDDPEYQRLQEVSDDWCSRAASALRDLLEVRPLSIADALLQLDLAIGGDEPTEPILADLRRLTGIARPILSILEPL